jgi:hypothetical protein
MLPLTLAALHCNSTMSSPLIVKISRDGKEIGTYPETEIARLLADGTLKETDLYWQDGMTDKVSIEDGDVWWKYSLFYSPKEPKYFEFCFLLHGALMTFSVWVMPIYLSFNSRPGSTPFSALFWEKIELLCALNAAVLSWDWILALLVRTFLGGKVFQRIFRCDSWVWLLLSTLLVMVISIIIYTASAYFFDFFDRKNFFNGGGYDDGLYRR